MKRLLTLLLATISINAIAMTYFLTNQYLRDGKHFCEYSNGDVMVVMGACPMSIER